MSLNPLEESVANLIKIKEQVAPSGQSFGVENIQPEMDVDEIMDNSISPSEIQIESLDRPTSSASQITRNRRKCKNVESERLELLKLQTQTQKELLAKIEQLEKTIYKNYEINKKLLEVKKQKLEIYKKQAKEAHELHTLKVEVQKLKIAKMRALQ